MKKLVRISESNLVGLIKKVLKESRLEPTDDLCDIICNQKVAEYGSRGEAVKQLQHALAKCSFNKKNRGGGMYRRCDTNYQNCDGIFESETQKAVEEFQKEYNIPATGKVDKTTLEKMMLKCMKPFDCECPTDDFKKEPTDDYEKPIKHDRIKVDCDEIIDCLDQWFYIPAPDVYNLEKCLSGEKNYIKQPPTKKPNCGDCPEYINLMPGLGSNAASESYYQKGWAYRCVKMGCTKVAY